MDLQGPLDKSILGYTYTLGVIDDHSQKGWKEFLQHKDEAPDLIKTLIQQLETYTGQQVKIVHSDHGREFINAKLGTYFKHKGILHEYTAPPYPSTEWCS